MLTIASFAGNQCTQNEEPERTVRLPFLDGLRALGIILTMQFHSQGQISRLCSARGGWWGIEIFFVLSGFLITSVLFDEQRLTQTISLRNFYIRRAIRLLPALAAYLAVILIVNPFGSPSPAIAVLIAMFYWSDFDVAFGLGHLANSGLNITWSLAIEEKYYAVWPLMAKHLRAWLPIFSLSAIISCIAWRGFLLLHGATWVRMFALDTHLDGIMLGSLMAALLYRQRARQLLTRILAHTKLLVPLFALMLLLVRTIAHPESLAQCSQKLLFFCVMVPSMQLIFAALIVSLYLTGDSPLKRFLSCRWLTWIGEISYSLYLWHAFAFLIIAKRVSGPSAEIAGWCLAFGLACLSYYAIEMPCSRLRKFFHTSGGTVHDVNFGPVPGLAPPGCQ